MAEQKIGTANIEIGVKSTVPQDLEASKKSLKDFASSTKQASQEVEKSMADASSAVAKMEASSDNLSRAQKRTADSIIRSAQRQSSESKAAYLDWVAAQSGVTNATQAARDKLRQWEAQQAESVSAGRKYIQMLKEQTETLGMNRRELMQYQAAQLGVSDQAAPLIAKMFDTSKAYTAVEMSAKQTRQAMRLLPAQITDVVTSLASGMPFYLVAIQQGGQLRDSFGGFGNVLRGVAALISPAALAMGALATVGGTAYYAYEAFTGTLQSMNRTLIETGNFAGVTSDQMASMAKNVSANVGSQKEAAQALNAIVSSQALIGQSYEDIAQAAVAWSRATGASVDDVVKKFIALGEDPAEAMVKLNREMNFLTAAQYRQVDALIEQGDKTEASRILIEAMANTMNQRMPQMLEQTSIFARMWTTLKDNVSSATTAVGSFIDRMVSGGPLQEQYNSALAKYFEIANAIEQLQMNPAGVEDDIAFLEKQLQSQTELLAVLNQEIVVRGQQAMSSKENAAAVEFEISLKKFLTDGITAEAKVQQQLNAVIQQYLKLANDKNITDLQRIAIEGALAEQVNKIWEAYLKQGKATTGVTKATKDVNEEIRKMISNYEFETELMVMNNIEREKAKFIREMETKGIKENSTAWRENLDAFTAAQMERMNQQSFIDAIKREEKAAEEALKARLKAEEKFAKEVEKINDQIGQSLSDAIMNGGKNAKEMLINLFKTLVLRPLLQPIIAGVTGMFAPPLASAMGVLGSDGSVGGGTSSLSMASGLKSAYDFVSTGFASVGESAAAFTSSLLGYAEATEAAAAAMTVGSSEAVAAALAQMESIASTAATVGAAATALAGAAAGFAAGELISGGKSIIGGSSMWATGGGTAIGAAIGSIVPGIGTAIGAAVGGIVGGIVNAAFGSGKKEYTDSGIRGQLNAMGADLQEYQKWKKAGGWFSSTKRGTEFNDINAELKQGLDQALGNVALGVAYLAGSLKQPVDAITSFSKQVDISFKNLSEQEITAAIENEIKAFETGLIEAVIPTIRQFSYVNEDVSTTLKRLVNGLSTVNSVFTRLGFNLKEISLDGANAANNIIELVGGVETFIQITNSYYDNFYNAQEKIDNQTKALTNTFNALGMRMPSTNAEFRQFLEAAQAAGNDVLVANLLKLAPAFNELTVAIAQANQAILQEQAQLLSQIYQATGNTAAIRQTELNATDESNRALLNHIYAIEDAARAQELANQRVADATAALNEAVSTESKRIKDVIETQLQASLDALAEQLDAVTQNINSQIEALQLQKQVTQESLSNIKNIFNLLGDNIRDILGLMQPTSSAAQGMAFVRQALIVARTTGYLPNAEDLRNAIGAARGGLGAESFGSAFEMRRANIQFANELIQLQEIASRQEESTQQQVDSAEEQIELLRRRLEQAKQQYDEQVVNTRNFYNAQLTSQQQQLNALLGINSGVLSLSSAMQGMAMALDAQSIANAALLQAQQQAAAAANQATATPQMTPFEQGVNQLYQQLLGRSVDVAGLQYWKGTGQSLASIESDIKRSFEYRRIEIQKMYRDILGREADAAGLAYWMNDSSTLSQIRQNLIIIKSTGQYAEGGYYPGGMALVGEEGPELINFNRPGQVYTASETRDIMSSSAESSNEIRQLREETRAQSRAMVALQARMTRIIERWDGDGIPTERYEGATA